MRDEAVGHGRGVDGAEHGEGPGRPILTYAGPVALRGEAEGEPFAVAGTVLVTADGEDAVVRLIPLGGAPDAAPSCRLPGAVAPLLGLVRQMRRGLPVGVGVGVAVTVASRCGRVLPEVWPW